MKQKILILFALILPLSSYVSAQIQPPLFPGQVLPDNIVNATCFVPPPSTQWSIRQLAKTPDSDFVHIGSCVLTGDIDGDGEIELIVQRNIDRLTDSRITQIYIYGFNKVTNSLYLKYQIAVPSENEYPLGNITIANVNGNKYASIFYTSSNRFLYKYDYDSGTNTYKTAWSKQFSNHANYLHGTPIVADFNNHGRAQVNVYDKIYDAITGNLLVDAGYLGNSNYSFGLVGHASHKGMAINRRDMKMSSMHAGDIDGDGKLEIIGGDCVYKVTIADPINASASNKFELLRRANKTGRTDIEDGGTALVDMDMDGQLDVVVVAKGIFNTNSSVYVYNPRTGNIMHTNQINNVPRPSDFHGPSMPFVGDIDGDGCPEIALTGNRVLQTYKLNTETNQLGLFWSIGTTDRSAATSLTLFDFNQSGISQLIYRDEDNLRIIDGRAGVTNRVLATFNNVQSATINEYPTVADINGDGQAEIIVTGTPRKQDPSWVIGGALYIFSSGDPLNHPWAPARSVWNANAYNAVNVNEDLTIPRVQFNPATVFSGSGTDVRPFNNFLQQQTTLNQDGVPLWLAANGQIIGSPTFSYNDITDKMTITVQVENVGEAIFQDSFYLTVYKENIGNTSKHPHKHEATIAIGATINITIEINNYIATFGDGEIVINLNDKGDGNRDQLACGSFFGKYHFGFANIEDCRGNAKILTCNITLSGTNTYQWQSSIDGFAWADILGATEDTYNVANQKPGITYYKVVVSNGTESADGALTKMTVYGCVMPVNPNIHIFK